MSLIVLIYDVKDILCDIKYIKQRRLLIRLLLTYIYHSVTSWYEFFPGLLSSLLGMIVYGFVLVSFQLLCVSLIM